MSTARKAWNLVPILLGAIGGGCGGDQEPVAAAVTAPVTSDTPARLDLLFMIDNSSSMNTAQQKLSQEMQSFAAALEGLPGGLPDLHVAVVSSDLGAPGDATVSIGCTAGGDGGQFQFVPRGPCTSAGLNPGATFISNSGGVANYTGSLAEVLTCIAALGDKGCGFEHQLASVARALGVDGLGAAPPANAGFLRPDAELAIILLTNEDDCSAPPDTQIYSLNGGQQSITNPLGPIANYRCNQLGHICKDPTAADRNALMMPPLEAPLDATGDPPVLTLTQCSSDDGCSGWLTPIPALVSGIKALKADPSRIVVGAIVAPPDPYTITWVAPAPPLNASGELWPQIMHSCGAPGGDDVNPAGQQSTDGTFGDPAVRIVQWVRAFGANGFVSSICDPTYTAPMQQFAALIATNLWPSGAVVPASPPVSTLPLANSAACGGTHRLPGTRSSLVTSACDTSGGRPVATSLLLAALGLGLAIRRRRPASVSTRGGTRR